MTGLKLRDDAYYVPTSEGIRILSNSGEAVLTGPSIFQWVDRLAPYLDGTHTLTELTGSMPAERRVMTERVVNALREHGMVVEVAQDHGQADPLTSDEQRLYRREIDFLGYFGPSAPGCFHAYRESAVVLAGGGRILVETVAAALSSGSRQLRIVLSGDCPADAALLAECERRGRQRDPRQQITHAVIDIADEEQLTAVLDGASVVVYASDRAAVEQVRTIDRLCGRSGIAFIAAILSGDEAWLGPFGLATGLWPGWMSAWRRRLAMDRHQGTLALVTQDTDSGGAPDGDLLAEAAAPTVVANQLIREVVRLLSGTAEEAGQARMTRIDLRILRTGRHRFLPHPFALPAASAGQAGLLITIERLREGEPLDADEFSRRVIACLEPRLGVLGEVTERDFTQVPLAVSQVPVSDPARLLGPGTPPPVVIGVGASLADARRAAVLRGLAAYASLMVDPRRLHVRGDTPEITGDPEEDLAALVAGKWNGFVWGYSLADGVAVELPAAEVFPALNGVRSFHAPPVGAAAGYDWDQAIREGLIDQCRQLTLSEITSRRHPFASIEWNEVAMDVRGDRYRSMMKIVDGELDVYDVTGSPRVPMLAFCLDGVTVAYTCGFSFGEALRDGLAEVLLWHQARAEGEPGYAPAPVPPLPPRERVSRVACPARSTDQFATAGRLARLGWTAVAVPLDHDPAVTTSIMPYLVNVVLTRA